MKTEIETTRITTKRFEMPNIIIILLVMMFLAMLATWVVPSGEYQREAGPDGRMIVVPNSFDYIENERVGLFKLFEAIPIGLTESGMIGFTVLIIGGAWAVINATGAITVGVDKIVSKLKGRELIAIPLMMLVFASVSAFIGALELAIVYLPVIIPLALVLRFDTLTAAAIVLVAVGGAFSASLTNPFTVGLGQNIAGLPLYSGIGFRWIVLISFLTVGIVYVLRYARKVRQDPKNSLVYEENQTFIKEVYKEQKIEARPEHTIIGLILLAGFALIIYGVLKQGWFMYEIGAIFFIVALVVGILGKLSLNQIAEEFIEGSKSVIVAVLAIGLARSIVVIIENGKIIDTIIMGLFTLVQSLPESITIVGVLIVQSLFNFLVPSGSGQTLITMPILAPLADLIGVTRQTTVLATQLGDGITNILYPVSGALMACLAYAKIPFEKWVRFIFPLILIWTAMGAIFLIIAQAIKWGPF